MVTCKLRKFVHLQNSLNMAYNKDIDLHRMAISTSIRYSFATRELEVFKLQHRLIWELNAADFGFFFYKRDACLSLNRME